MLSVAPNSKHTDGTGFMIAMTNRDTMAVEATARAVSFLDLRSNASHEWKHHYRPEQNGFKSVD